MHTNIYKRQMVLGFAVLILLSLGSCEKVIKLDLPSANSLVYLDGFITDSVGVQSVKLLKAPGYLDSAAPKPVADATITLTDLTLGTSYPMSYQGGAYSYDAGTGKIGVVGHIYQLSVNWSGAQFIARDTMKRVPPIDSVNYTYKKDDGNKKDGYYVTFFSVDFPGATDWYWIRAFRNGARNGYVFDQVSIDGAFAENTNDGLEFIYPLREGVTANDKPYVKGDSVRIVLRSLSKNSFDFMQTALNQLFNGGLFATVLANVPANLVNQTPGNTARIYGWFGMTAQTERSTKIK